MEHFAPDGKAGGTQPGPPARRLHPLAYGIECIGLIALRAPVVGAVIFALLVIGAVFGLDRLKVDVNSVYQKVESLSGGRQQSVAIARAISFDPKVVVFDEPTANLSVTATNRLLETIMELKRHNVAQVIISHRMTDIFEVGDRVMVLKRGQNVGDRRIAETTEREVLELIVSGVPETARPAEASLSARNRGLGGSPWGFTVVSCWSST